MANREGSGGIMWSIARRYYNHILTEMMTVTKSIMLIGTISDVMFSNRCASTSYRLIFDR